MLVSSRQDRFTTGFTLSGEKVGISPAAESEASRGISRAREAAQHRLS